MQLTLTERGNRSLSFKGGALEEDHALFFDNTSLKMIMFMPQLFFFIRLMIRLRFQFHVLLLRWCVCFRSVRFRLLFNTFCFSITTA